MNKQEIKYQNKKALSKFLIVLILCCVGGMVLGFLSSSFNMGSILNEVIFNKWSLYFSKYISGLLLTLCTLILIVYVYPKYKRVQRIYDSWDGENEDVLNQIDRELSKVIWLNGSFLILGFFFVSTVCYSVLTIDSFVQFVICLIGLVSFIVLLFITVRLEQKCVDLTKQMNPEKNGSVYDFKFNEKWLASCDEAERILIGRCAYKAYVAVCYTCIFLMLLLTLLAPIFHFGIVPHFVVCVIWFVNVYVFSKESLRCY